MGGGIHKNIIETYRGGGDHKNIIETYKGGEIIRIQQKLMGGKIIRI